ncbi:conserved unknown protein [Ectocarpus siliculosus]|uniref:ABC transmembrane type-1 domain-containing protein n=1 Tax=Ectocarpus siliculosus TaxID=2880 RepID=D7G0W4_ECTSI|nr:conserved unknown protein [Ectocarpus siliculosus]|eukprot:CBJ26708.1 conserved unknown protein [Ectocarpus siliculosus]
MGAMVRVYLCGRSDPFDPSGDNEVPRTTGGGTRIRLRLRLGDCMVLVIHRLECCRLGSGVSSGHSVHVDLPALLSRPLLPETGRLRGDIGGSLGGGGGGEEGKVLVPHFTGNMIDNVVEGGGDSEFRRSTVYLVLAAVSCAIFSGIRGCIFSVVGARVNVRVRRRLFESLVRQEIGFFDTTKTGDLTSRLASDCTKVGDQVTLNVNVFLRNLVMVVVTLLFMFYLSWRLSLVAFISVPAIVIVSKWYGEYIRKLSKLSQDKLAEAGSVAEESLGSMSTVRSFAAEGRESKEYAKKLQDRTPTSPTLPHTSYTSRLSFYVLSKRGSYAYGFYASSYVLLPNLVTAVVLFYGGQLVMDGQITGGKVVSFMIYLTSLSDGFNDMAAIFSSMTQAVGAADKVFELIRRKPKGPRPSASPPPSSASQHSACETGAARSVRHATAAAFEEGGAAPETCLGAVELKGVDFEYPSRPGRRILDGVSFNAAAGQASTLAMAMPSMLP